MIKRDKIFYAACGLCGVGALLAALGYELSLVMFVSAYLLRPALHESGLAKQFADERELKIHSRSGNVAFVVLMLALVGMVFWRIADNESTGELYTLIGIGLAARALTGLVMAGEYRKAGVLIISAVGVFFAIFVVLMAGVSPAALLGLVPGLIIVGIGQLARKFPKSVAITLVALAVSFVVIFELYHFKRNNTEFWLLFVMPVFTASACLLLGGAKDEEFVSTKVRSIVFGSLGAGATVVFALLLIVGSGEDHSTGRRELVPEGEVVEVQGVPCSGNIEYYKSGALEHCSLARDDTLSGQPLAAGTGVHFTEAGVFEWCFLRETTLIQGYLCKGEGHGFMTRFYPNGQLRVGWLAENQIIQGIPCAKFQFLSALIGWAQGGVANKNGSTGFHENGMLKFCELSENFTIEGQRFRRGDAIGFDQNGKLIPMN